MVNIDLVVLVTATILNSILSLVVFLRNPKRLANIAFMTFGTSIILWTVFNYLADNASSQNLLFTNLTLLAGSFIVVTLAFLSTVFPATLKPSKLLVRILAAVSVINAALCLADIYVPSVAKKPEGGVELTVSFLYYAYTLFLLFFLGLSIVYFIKQLRASHGIGRSQIKLFMLGVGVYFSFALASNVLLPLILDDWSSSRFGPIFTVPFVAITSYAIIKHHLFDIRGFVVRVVAYTLTLATVVVIYSLMIVLVVARVISLDNLSVPQLISLALPTIICALTFRPIQQFIDRVTTKIFYRHAYSLREVLNKLSDTFVTETSIKGIMSSSGRLIGTAIRPGWMHFAVFNDSDSPYAVVLNRTDTIDLEPFVKALAHEKSNLINVDIISPATPIAAAMTQANVTLVLRLGKRKQPTGLILFGPKGTGSIYTKKDLTLLQIAAKNLGIALENAKNYEEIAHFNETLKEEVKHATSRLRRANEELKSLDKLKDDFISMASHQFRTPAASVHQALQMINNPSMSKKDRDEMLKLAEVNSAELVSLVSTMLSISRLQAGRFMIDKSLVNPSDLIDKIIQTTTIVADQKHTKLDFKRPDKMVMVEADVAKLREAVTNYIENAIKYSPENSTVTITVRQEDDRVYFEVTDQGMGVPEAERASLFGKFYRAQNARQQHPDGNGIGLYVVKNVAEGHGGKAYYQALEHGSLFGLWIPVQSRTTTPAKD